MSLASHGTYQGLPESFVEKYRGKISDNSPVLVRGSGTKNKIRFTPMYIAYLNHVYAAGRK